jgi:hypothetical protein
LLLLNIWRSCNKRVTSCISSNRKGDLTILHSPPPLLCV